MYSSKLLSSSVCIVQFLRCSPLSRVPLTQQVCCMRTDERGRLAERSIVTNRRTTEGSIIDRKNASDRNSRLERKSRSKKGKVKVEVPLIVKRNPGIGRYAVAIAEETGVNFSNPRSCDENLEEESEDFSCERNFFDVHEDLNEINREQRAHKKKLAYLVTKQKFFKPPMEPNLLTYSEKEHIKFLYNNEHQNWTVESLVESYPATKDTIKKILKGKWKPRNAAEIRKHDEKVRRNWEALKKGDLLIHSEDLKRHLKQFLGREVKVPSLEDAQKFITKPEKKPRRIDEFSKIIESYRMLHPPNNPEVPSLIGQSVLEAEPIKIKKSEIDQSSFQSVFEEIKSKTRKSEPRYTHSFSESASHGTEKTNKSESQDKHSTQSIFKNERSEIRETEMKGKYKHQSAFTVEKEFEKKESKSSSAHAKPESEEPKLIQENERTNRRAKHFTLNKLRDSLEKEFKWEEDIGGVDKQIIKSRKKKEFEAQPGFDYSENEKLNLSITDESATTKESGRKKAKESRNKEPNESKTELSFVKRIDNQLVMRTFDQDLVEELKVAEYIKIPKHLKKEGALYKVKDCFYADDGQFLYRVPGLKS